MRKLFIIPIIFFMLLSGCATIHNGASVCDSDETYSRSWLCQAAGASGLPLEEYGYIILDLEAGLVIAEAVDPEQIKSFVDEIRQFLEFGQGKTYADLIRKSLDTAKKKAIFQLISRRLIVFNSDLPISEIDLSFLLWQLDQIEAQV
jgi:hypothetical protein